MSIENANLNTGSCSENALNTLFLLFSSLLVFSITFPVLITVEHTLACYVDGPSQDKSRTENRDRLPKER